MQPAALRGTPAQVQRSVTISWGVKLIFTEGSYENIPCQVRSVYSALWSQNTRILCEYVYKLHFSTTTVVYVYTTMRGTGDPGDERGAFFPLATLSETFHEHIDVWLRLFGISVICILPFVT